MNIIVIVKVALPVKEGGKYKVKKQDFVLCENRDFAELYLHDVLEWNCVKSQHCNFPDQVYYRYNYDANVHYKHFEFAVIVGTMRMNRRLLNFKGYFENTQWLIEEIHEKAKSINRHALYKDSGTFEKIDDNLRYTVKLPAGYVIAKEGAVTKDTIVLHRDRTMKGLYEWESVECSYFDLYINKADIYKYTYSERVQCPFLLNKQV